MNYLESMPDDIIFKIYHIIYIGKCKDKLIMLNRNLLRTKKLEKKRIKLHDKMEEILGSSFYITYPELADLHVGDLPENDPGTAVILSQWDEFEKQYWKPVLVARKLTKIMTRQCDAAQKLLEKAVALDF